MEFEDISDAYAVIEMYDYGSIDERKYLEACAYALEHYRKKYGKDDFRFRELFALIQSEGWEGTFEVRALVHTEAIGCFYSTISECDKHKTAIELKFLKGNKCQHCSYLEGIKEKWDKKDG